MVALLAGPAATSLTGLPGYVVAADYAPHAPLFARAAAIVHHGGVGTTGQALRSGVPMLVVPHAHDQPDNAFRVKKLGVARVVDARNNRAATASAALDALLTNASYATKARGIGAIVRAEDGARAACDAIFPAAGKGEGR